MRQAETMHNCFDGTHPLIAEMRVFMFLVNLETLQKSRVSSAQDG
jgi:hypothetical protein